MTPHPLVDQDSKNELILAKQIRQSTCKILRRPSQFQGYDNKNEQLVPFSKRKEKIEHAMQNKQPPIVNRRLKKEDENSFENTFQSNFKEQKRLTEYETRFEALHHEIEYEVAENRKPTYLEPKHSTKIFPHSSNLVRDNLANKNKKDTICLDNEPDVTPSQNFMKIFTNSIDRKIKHMTPALPDLEVAKPPIEISHYQMHGRTKKKEVYPQRLRKCPDPNLYEDILEHAINNQDKNSMQVNGRVIQKTPSQSSSPEPDKDIRTPFQNLQNSLFSMFTAIVPWCLMKKVYWKRDKRSDKLYERTARMNKKNKKMSEERVEL